MYDSPKPNQSVGGFTYGVVPFLVLHFTLTLLTMFDIHAVYNRRNSFRLLLL